jgi:prepilin-type N-terminal cleavage/methylation domain-containing protein
MRAGFSLIELIVVLFIMAVCTAVALPAFVDRGPRDPAYAAAEELSMVIRSASHRSSQLQRQVNLVIDGSRYALRSIARDARMDLVEGTLALPAGVRIEPAGVHAFTFLPGGGAWGDSVVIRSDTTRLLVRVSVIGEPLVSP